MPPVRGIPLDCLDPTLGIPSEFSRWASVSTTRWASLTLVLENGCRTLSAGQPATSRGLRGYVPWLTREGKGHGGSPFCPLGTSFQAGAVATLYRRRIRSARPVRRKKTVRWRIYGGSYRIYRICPLVVAVYKYPVVWLSFSLLPSALIPAFASLPSHARAHPRAVADPPFFHPRTPVRLVATDDWPPSSMTKRRLLELEREGLLRHRTSLSSPEWIAPPADHREPKPPKGYVVSFAKF